MTPKLLSKIAERTAPLESKLAKIGLGLIVLFFLGAGINSYFTDAPVPIVFVPLILLFIIGLIGFIQVWYKPKPDKENVKFEEYWQGISLVRKSILWYGALFYSIAAAFLIFMLFITIFLTILHAL